ncbi:pyranose oxidase [Sistotremastrum niveocremeum HHB9708]|uniref:Pyranose 2-oxidase n=1 Tax=Sistotremastrum niveocremeum HHB9708 TaxID=1314777 RepID=A0A164P3C5_9AGAM|nr:pyranose oxidase [Sistotremastrum niveocremeum HHB9708]
MPRVSSFAEAKVLPQLEADVFIAGSGPIGATFAVELHRLRPDLKIIMTEIGGLDTVVPGSHKKNSVDFQKDIDRFVNVIQGDLSTVSVPVTNVPVTNADPESKWYLRNNQNPEQAPEFNLGAEAVTRCVGGMSTHWTCACPELHPTLERPLLSSNQTENDALWKDLYPRARKLIGVGDDQFAFSIRHQLVLQTLTKAFPKREFKELPLACHRNPEAPKFVTWHSANTVFQSFGVPLTVDENEVVRAGDFFELYPNTRCTRVWQDPSTETGEIALAECQRLRVGKAGQDIRVKAKVYIIAAGAVGTPQILANSYFRTEQRMPALGKYITEQMMAFCQIMLYRELINKVRDKPEPEWKARVEEHIKEYPLDPIAMPFDEPEPQVTSPVHVDHPWHTQIHRDAFSYGKVGATIDSRVVVDLRFFGRNEPLERNTLTFSKVHRDGYDMPQPTFHFQMSEKSRKESAVATKIGGYLPGSEPQFLEPGLVLHLASYSVVDTYSKVHDFSNLYLGGNGIIPTAFAANPTLTSICYAIRASEHIAKNVFK